MVRRSTITGVADLQDLEGPVVVSTGYCHRHVLIRTMTDGEPSTWSTIFFFDATGSHNVEIYRWGASDGVTQRSYVALTGDGASVDEDAWVGANKKKP
jgi:hypothetical protein